MLNGIYTGVFQSKVKNFEFLFVLPHCFGGMILTEMQNSY
jgi:hypothetical protein